MPNLPLSARFLNTKSTFLVSDSWTYIHTKTASHLHSHTCTQSNTQSHLKRVICCDRRLKDAMFAIVGSSSTIASYQFRTIRQRTTPTQPSFYVGIDATRPEALRCALEAKANQSYSSIFCPIVEQCLQSTCIQRKQTISSPMLSELFRMIRLLFSFSQLVVYWKKFVCRIVWKSSNMQYIYIYI